MAIYFIFLIIVKILAFWLPIHFYQEYREQNEIVQGLHGQSVLNLRYVLPEINSKDPVTEIQVQIPTCFELGKTYKIRYEIKNPQPANKIEFVYLVPENFIQNGPPIIFTSGGPRVIDQDVYYDSDNAPDGKYYIRAELVATIKADTLLQKYQPRYVNVYSPKMVDKFESARIRSLILAIATLIFAIALFILWW